MSKQLWKIKLHVKSPFLIGTNRVIPNHFDTLDYIPANVLQAAFSRAILESHHTYEPSRDGNYRFIIPDNPSDEDIKSCREEWREWYRHFSNIAFTDATPFGSEKITPTTYQCKDFGHEHTLRETLAERYKIRDTKGAIIQEFYCSECEGRLERKDGWNDEKSKIYKRLVTRLEIDEKRLVSKDERLYSIAVGEAFVKKDTGTNEFEPLIFEAFCYTDKDVNLQFPVGKQIYIRIGAYTTTGYGLMEVEVEKIDQLQMDTLENYKKWLEETESTDTVALKILSDLPLIKFNYGNNLSTEDQLTTYTQWLRAVSNLPNSCYVDYTVLQTYRKRSYMKGSQRYRRDKITQFIENGSVIVIKGEKSADFHDWLETTMKEGIYIHSDERKIQIPVKVLSGIN